MWHLAVVSINFGEESDNLAVISKTDVSAMCTDRATKDGAAIITVTQQIKPLISFFLPLYWLHVLFPMKQKLILELSLG